MIHDLSSVEMICCNLVGPACYLRVEAETVVRKWVKPQRSGVIFFILVHLRSTFRR